MSTTDRPPDLPIVVHAAEAMFGSVHGYHPDLNWSNASPEHKELYLKLSRIAQPIFADHYTTGDYAADYQDDYIA